MSAPRSEERPTHDEMIKRLADLKAFIQQRVGQLEEELDKLRSIMAVVDGVLAERSFKPAEPARPIQLQITPPKPSTAPPTAVPTVAPAAGPSAVTPPEYRQMIPLKTSAGILLAKMYVSDNTMRVVPLEETRFSVNTPPFQAFLINRVLESMQNRDRELVKTGSLTPDKALSYKVLQDGDMVTEIIVQNYGDEKRLREIKTSLRWTLEKVYEKRQKQ